MELQTGLVGLSSNGRQQVVAGATHDMPFEKPDVIVDAIREVLDGSGRLTTSAVRMGGAGNTGPAFTSSGRRRCRYTGRSGEGVGYSGGSHWRRGRPRHQRPAGANASAARPSTASRRMPGIVSSPPMTRRSRRISRPRSTRRPGSRRDRGRDHHGTGRGPRLRQPVRAVDRSPRTRARRLLRTAAARYALRRTRAPRTRAIILSGGPLRCTTRMPPSPTRLSGPGHPGPRHLLWRPADGAGARW